MAADGLCQHRDMFDDLLAANQRYASTFAHADVQAPTRKHLAVVTCMDTRIDPLAVLGLAVGDAKIIRNAGGRVTDDALRSLVLAMAFLDVTHIVVMHHTRCALAGQSDDEVRGALPEERRGGVADGPLLAMPDPDAALRADVEAVRRCPQLTGAVVEGWRYDVATGTVARMVPS